MFDMPIGAIWLDPEHCTDIRVVYMNSSQQPSAHAHAGLCFILRPFLKGKFFDVVAFLCHVTVTGRGHKISHVVGVSQLLVTPTR